MAFEWLRDRSRLEVDEQALESNLEPLPSRRASKTHCTQLSSSLLSRTSHCQDALLDPAELKQQIRAYRMCSTCQLSTSTTCRPYTYQAKARNPCSQRRGKWWGQSQPAANSLFGLNPKATTLCLRPLNSTPQSRCHRAVIYNRSRYESLNHPETAR
jgi:hypothetical protein